MLAHHYPFIDLAVHAAIRDRFARGGAVAVFSPDLGEVLWANGAAAHLFGFDTIYDVLEEGIDSQPVTRRQIESAVSGLQRTGKPQNFTMRLAKGFSRAMTPALLEHITLPDGAQALLLSSQTGTVLAPGARARQIISGFEGTGTHVAVLDAEGGILAASRTFGDIGLANADITRMIADVASEEDRLVKRMIEARNGSMPAAIGRLADDPLLHLLFAVEPAQEEDQPEDMIEAPVSATGLTSGLQDGAQPSEIDETAPTEPEAEPALQQPEPVEPETVETETGGTGADEDTVAAEASGSEPADAGAAAVPVDNFDADRVHEELTASTEAPADADDLALPFTEARGLETPVIVEDATATVAETDNSQDQTDDDIAPESGTPVTVSTERGELQPKTTTDQPAAAVDEPQPAHTASAPHVAPSKQADAAVDFTFDPNSKPARFVWKIDRDGAFSEVSPEFAIAVGPNAADIIGRKFPDLARVFNLDPDHVITDLLNRRDTWSGRTVFWPIQGTDLVTPVDLAALPTYTRDRHFDGFRGFGIVRSGETRKDPEALGLALVSGSPTDNRNDADSPSNEGEAMLESLDMQQDLGDLARLDGIDGDHVASSGDEQQDADKDLTESGASTDDPFRGEQPAIRLVETQMRRDSDKIISLEARRPRAPRESLSPGEQAAFREIGARLSETSSASAEADAAHTASDDDAATSQQSVDQQSFGKRQSPAPDEQSAAGDIDITFDRPDEPDVEHVNSEASEQATAASMSDLTTDETPESDPATAATMGEQTPIEADPTPQCAAQEEDIITSEAAAVSEPDETPEVVWPTPVEPPLPSAFALPPRQVMQSGLDPHLVDAIPTALLVHTGDQLIHANAEFLELTGYGSLTELAADGGLEHLLDRPEQQEATIEDGGLIVRRGDGGTRMVTARLRSVNWGDGQALLLALSPIETITAAPVAPLHAVADTEEAASEETAPEDDTARKSEEAGQTSALEIETRELRSILETATDGVVILNNDGTIRSMNSSACALFNYDENETRTQPFAMLFAHESQRAVMDYINGLADHGVSSVLNDGREVIGREAAGGFLPLFMTIGRLTGSNGYCAVLRDITQWKRTEDELRTAKRAAETANSHKSDFLARVSHEIRTPLNAIIGFSEMMAEERFGPIGSPRYLEYAHDIGNSGKHVLDIVNDLLDISKIEAGQVDMEFVAVSLNDHLAESVSLLQPMANSQRVIIRTSLSVSVPDVVADQRSIKQIALNLLSNAIRYTPSGGQIVVSTSYESSGNVIIRIRDTGIGMNRKELEQAMKPFGQVGPGPRQRGEGTGLGLPLTKAMVEANRAQFDIVSAPGEGTLVSISFPPQRVLAD
ncbi:ATP-binding protein [Hoeflea sp. Naph1]|uniref:PAS domain-containing sensor histidine kinase n=1 Tax=Hoeflea sp. Naph1 TaxID=3388653 RepID=UPI00398FB744